MSRSVEQWLQIKRNLMNARADIRTSMAKLEGYVDWFGADDNGSDVHRDAMSALADAERYVDQLIGRNTVDWIEETRL